MAKAVVPKRNSSHIEVYEKTAFSLDLCTHLPADFIGSDSHFRAVFNKIINLFCKVWLYYVSKGGDYLWCETTLVSCCLSITNNWPTGVWFHVTPSPLLQPKMVTAETLNLRLQKRTSASSG